MSANGPKRPSGIMKLLDSVKDFLHFHRATRIQFPLHLDALPLAALTIALLSGNLGQTEEGENMDSDTILCFHFLSFLP